MHLKQICVLIKRRGSCKWNLRVLGGFWCAWSCLAPPAGSLAGFMGQMGPGGAPEEAVAGIRAVGGGLQSQIHHPQYEIKQPRCGWEVGMAGRVGLAPPRGHQTDTNRQFKATLRPAYGRWKFLSRSPFYSTFFDSGADVVWVGTPKL